MKMTTIQTNSILNSSILAALQIFILWVVNGDLLQILLSKDPVIVGTVFAPTIALVYVSRRYSNAKEEVNNDA